jgi:Family of unknown function (DUF5947)
LIFILYLSVKSVISFFMEQSFNALRRFIRPRKVVERCDLCSIELHAEHQHLIEPKSRQLSCACDACAILFSNQGDGKFSRVPRRSTFLPDFHLTDLQWSSLMLPIQLAFFFKSSPEDRVIALYPSPAGAMESLLTLDAWEEIERENAVLQKMQPDVEALLVNRVKEKREYFIAPIDECYKLVGLIRAKWTGLSGGTEVWQEIEQFFDNLKEHSFVKREVQNA